MAKMNPPLRTADDVAAISRVSRRTLDVIARTRAHALDEKSVEFDARPSHRGSNQRRVVVQTGAGGHPFDGRPHNRIARRCTDHQERRRMLSVGAKRTSPSSTRTGLDRECFAVLSKSKNTPFDGWKLKGRPWTIVEGRINCGFRIVDCGL